MMTTWSSPNGSAIAVDADSMVLRVRNIRLRTSMRTLSVGTAHRYGPRPVEPRIGSKRRRTREGLTMSTTNYVDGECDVQFNSVKVCRGRASG